MITMLSRPPLNEKKRIAFIVNPLSHKIKDLNLQKIIEKNLNLDQFDYTIVYTQRPLHATELAHEALKHSFDIIAAAGGDGTVNEVGKALIHSNAHLAIIPVGSGNGLARHFNIPTGLEQGIRALNQSAVISIDTAKINGQVFLGVAGIGFDAHVAEHFANFGKRGFFSYAKVALREFPKYQSQFYQMTIDGRQITRKAFILTFANSTQYGNNFIIAPKAEIDDGHLDLIIIDNIPWYSSLRLLYQFKRGTLDHSKYFESYRFKDLTLRNPLKKVHIDGEPLIMHEDIRVTVQRSTLKIVVPKK